MTDKEIVEEFWKKWEQAGSFTRYDVPNKDFIEETLIKGIKLGRKQLAEELLKENVSCRVMSKEFIKGSDWCNGLWKNKIKEKLKAKHTDGWWLLTIPVLGWLFSILIFGFYLPFRYFHDNGKYNGCNCGK